MTAADLLRQAEQHYNAGDHKSAEDLFARAIELDGANVAAWRGLVRARQVLGNVDQIIAALRCVVSLAPDDAAAQLDLGKAWHSMGQLALAEHHLRAALRADPNLTDAYWQLGETLARSGDWRQAGAAYYECLRRRPRDVTAVLRVVEALCRTGQSQRAAGTLETALKLIPRSPELHVRLGALLLEMNRPADAIGHFETAAQSPAVGLEARRGLAAALEAAGQGDRGLTIYRALARDLPERGELAADLGHALLRRGLLAEAEGVLRQGRQMSPFDHGLAAALATCLARLGKEDEAVAVRAQAAELAPVPNERLRAQLSALLYDISLDPVTLKTRSQVLVEPYERTRRHPPADRGDREPDRPLRIGWLSSDLRFHVVAMNLWPVVDNLDREMFHNYFYADSDVDDPMTRRFKGRATQWRAVAGKSDAELAAAIRADAIDILVILAGRLDQNRPVIAARRAAPVQISFHDPATSGLDAMDYLVSDRYLTPPGSDAGFTERLLRLPSFYVREAPEDDPLPNDLPMLRSEGITFGSLSNPLKITRRTIALWARVLSAVPRARLVLRYYGQYDAPSVRDPLVQAFRAEGIDPGRLSLPTAMADFGSHLASYHEIDLALDPLPFSGSTTTFESLWMGVPVLSCPGPTMVSRWSGAMLHALHLDDFIAPSEDAYFAIARDWAAKPEALARLRQELRQRLRASPLCNGALRGRQIGRLLRAVWRRYCAARRVAETGD